MQAVVTAEGSMLNTPLKLDFSGYEWLVRETEGSPAGSRNQYESANAWVDERGFLHLRIRETPAGWTSAEVGLVPSLGYGSYRFVVSDVSRLEPPVVLAISNGSGLNREMDIEISRWGALAGKNSQYVVQPFDVAANVVRFLSPPGRLTYSFDWGPGRIGFRTVRGAGPGGNADLIAAHLFTSGVPSPGSETLHLNLYILKTTEFVFNMGRRWLVRNLSTSVMVRQLPALLWLAMSLRTRHCDRSQPCDVAIYPRPMGAEQEFPGAVYAIAQSSDGYLWIGTQAGLVDSMG